MKITLAPYEKKTVNSSGGIFTVVSITTGGAIELSAKGLDDIPLEPTDQINIKDARQVSLQNISDKSVDIDYTIKSRTLQKPRLLTKRRLKWKWTVM